LADADSQILPNEAVWRKPLDRGGATTRDRIARSRRIFSSHTAPPRGKPPLSPLCARLQCILFEKQIIKPLPSWQVGLVLASRESFFPFSQNYGRCAVFGCCRSDREEEGESLGRGLFRVGIARLKYRSLPSVLSTAMSWEHFLSRHGALGLTEFFIDGSASGRNSCVELGGSVAVIENVICITCPDIIRKSLSIIVKSS
jgi:hypothetical protein